jgi:hypothetical protein
MINTVEFITASAGRGLGLRVLKSLSDAGAQALAKKKGGKHKMSLPSEIQKQVDKYKKK